MLKLMKQFFGLLKMSKEVSNSELFLELATTNPDTYGPIPLHKYVICEAHSIWSYIKGAYCFKCSQEERAKKYRSQKIQGDAALGKFKTVEHPGRT